jgi:metal-dependent HD superfamily phosphatase/phosphodiesterase
MQENTINENKNKTEGRLITLEDIRRSTELRTMIDAANDYLRQLGFTEHGPRHVGYVCRVAADVLRRLGYPEHQVELAAITGWVHDVGNCINRKEHGPNGAALLFPILRDMGMPIEDVLTIITAVGNHEEGYGRVSSPVSAALVIADKSDAHKSRVRAGHADPEHDIHDRVNLSIQRNAVLVDPEKRIIRHELQMDESSSVMEYLQIYMSRIVMCEEAAAYLGCGFDLVVNGHPVNNRSAQ